MTNKNEPLLIVNNLTKYFKKNISYHKAVNEANFVVNKGDFFGIIGESGSGKSTTGKMLIKLYSCSGGTVIFDNHLISQEKLSKKTKWWLCQNMQMIFQDPMSSLNPKKNVLSLISEPYKINKKLNAEAFAILERHKKIHQYFKYSYKYEDYLISHKFFKSYYEDITNIYQKGIQELENYNIDFNVDGETQLLEIISVLDDIEEKIKHINFGIYDYACNIRDISKKFYNMYKNNELPEQELNYSKSLDHYHDALKYAKFPLDYYNAKSDLNEINQKIKEKKYSIKETIAASSDFWKSVIYSFKIAKNNYNKSKITSLTNKDFDFYKEKCEEQENIIEYLKKFTVLKNLSINQIQEIYNFVQNNRLDSFDNDKYLNEWIAINDTSRDNLNSELNELLENKQSLINKINDIKSNNSEWLQTDEYFKHKTNLEQAKLELDKNKEIWTHFRNNEIENFNNNQQLEINSFNGDLKSWLNDYKCVKKQYIKLINEIRWKLFKTKPNDVLINKFSLIKEVLLRKSLIKKINREISLKLKNLKSIDFEFETIMDEVALYRRIRTNSFFILGLNYFSLIKILTRAKVYKALNEVGLKNEHAYRYPHEFSGGQRQRIVIARALINNPQLIIADEPISALDVSIQAQVINIMKNLAVKKGITFIFIGHDLSMVNYACNRMIIMHNGTIVEKGNANEIFANPIHPYTISLIKAAPELSKIHVNLAAFSELDNYTKHYTNTNRPEFFSVPNENEHEVFATKDQFIKWTTKEN